MEMELKMGRRPAVFTRESLVSSHILARHLAELGPAPAISPDWVSAVMKQSPDGWGMDGNDQYGDCVFADCAHQEQLRTANVGQIWIPSVDDVLQLYSACTGFDPNDPSTDNGANEAAVIGYLTSTGWLGRKLDGHADIDPTNIDHMKWAVCIFGACRLGVNLPQSAMDQYRANQPWDVGGDYGGDQAPIGGHDVCVVQYNTQYAYVVTWGKLQPVTWGWMSAAYPDQTPYVEEMHAELAADFINAIGVSPSGFNLTQLLADLQVVAG